MQLTVLGSNGTYATPGRPPSGYLVSHEETVLWMDAGAGTFAALQGEMDPAKLDGIFLSHAHADHCLDVFGFYYAVRLRQDPPAAFPVFVPDGLEDRLIAFLGGGDHPISDLLEFRTVEVGGSVQLGSMTLRFGEADHPVPTRCLRIEAGGRSLTFSADTGTGGTLEELATGTDLLLCEATYQGTTAEKPWPHHLTAGEAGTLARKVGAVKLMLTHIWPTLDPGRSVAEAEETFGKAVHLAVPGVRTRI